MFQFRKFSVIQDRSLHKVGTDAMILGAWAGKEQNPNNILDIGTGTGVLALMLAQRFENANVTAIELDEQSSLDAKENFENAPWAQRLRLEHTDFEKFETDEKFDLVVSNPPYFDPTWLAPEMPKNSARHTFTLSHAVLLRKANELLTDNGIFSVILPFEDAERMIHDAHCIGLHLHRVCHVITKPNVAPKRQMIEFSKIENQTITEDFLLRDESGNYTPAYLELTHDFHTERFLSRNS